MKTKNQNAESGSLLIDPYSRMIMNYEICQWPEVENQRNRKRIKEMYDRLASQPTQIRPRADASRDMKPLTIKEFEELVNNAISRGNKCDS